jgi:hypothetical protein
MLIIMNLIQRLIVCFFLIAAGTMLAESNQHHESLGVLKGELSLPSGLFRGHPFILAYSATDGEKIIPVKEKASIATYEVRLKPGVYYIFVALDGYEPTCHVAEIDPDRVVEYNPTLGHPLELKIKDYFGSPEGTVQNWRVPIRTRPISPPQSDPQPPQ